MKIKAFISILTMLSLLCAGCGEKEKDIPPYPGTSAETLLPTQDETNEDTHPVSEEDTEPYEKKTVIESENFSYDSSMFIFTYFSDIYNYVVPYSSSYGIDPAISLDAQPYNLQFTWKGFLVEQTKTSILNLISIAEYARSVGHEFPELDQFLEEQMELWYGYAEDAGMTFEEYVTNYFGDRVTEEDIRNTFTVQFYAYSYNDILKTEALELFTEDYYDSYYEENKDSITEEYTTKNVCHILLTQDTYGSDEAAKAKAEELLALFESGDRSQESFEALAEEYNYDSSCYYENVIKDYMVEEFEAWIYDESRTEGETGIVKTPYGYHIMYFVGDGEENWKLDAKEAYIQEYLAEKTAKYYETFSQSFIVADDIASSVPGFLPDGFTA